jgi:hypothetical protein
LKLTVRPELAVADTEGAAAVSDMPGIGLKVIVCGDTGVTEFDGEDGALVPVAALFEVTVNA